VFQHFLKGAKLLKETRGKIMFLHSALLPCFLTEK